MIKRFNIIIREYASNSEFQSDSADLEKKGYVIFKTRRDRFPFGLVNLVTVSRHADPAPAPD